MLPTICNGMQQSLHCMGSAMRVTFCRTGSMDPIDFGLLLHAWVLCWLGGVCLPVGLSEEGG
jgi:hypothetical protein